MREDKHQQWAIDLRQGRTMWAKPRCRAGRTEAEDSQRRKDAVVVGKQLLPPCMITNNDVAHSFPTSGNTAVPQVVSGDDSVASPVQASQTADTMAG